MQVRVLPGLPSENIDSMKKAIEFLREVVSEVKKATWPSKQELIGSTIVVVVLVLFVAFYIAMVDFLLSRIMEVIM